MHILSNIVWQRKENFKIHANVFKLTCESKKVSVFKKTNSCRILSSIFMEADFITVKKKKKIRIITKSNKKHVLTWLSSVRHTWNSNYKVKKKQKKKTSLLFTK